MYKLLLLTLAFAMSTTAAVKIEKVNYQGWPNSYKISNGEIELVITSDIGPRIMRIGFVGGQNFFKEFKDTLGKSGEEKWQLRGGHRLWVAPEDIRYTYAPDNGPVKVEVKGDVLIATQPVEPSTGLEKQMIVKMAPGGTKVEVVHRIRNTTNFTLEIAAWAPTMMAQGGVGITGFPPRGTHPEMLAPTNPLVMSAYTDLSDKRWTFTKKYLALQQDPQAKTPQKLGTFSEHTWGAYLVNGEAFIKHSAGDPNKTYPDFNCSYETFTNADFLEMETLGPMTKVPSGGTVEHVERWNLFKNVPMSPLTDEALDHILLPLVNQ